MISCLQPFTSSTAKKTKLSMDLKNTTFKPCVCLGRILKNYLQIRMSFHTLHLQMNKTPLTGPQLTNMDWHQGDNAECVLQHSLNHLHFAEHHTTLVRQVKQLNFPRQYSQVSKNSAQVPLHVSKAISQ